MTSAAGKHADNAYRTSHTCPHTLDVPSDRSYRYPRPHEENDPGFTVAALSTDHIKKAIQKGWDEMANSYQSQTRISVDDVHYGPLSPGERELRVIGDVRGKRVLELACGAAQNSIAMAKWGAQVTALDFSACQLGAARKLIMREGVSVELVRGDMEGLTMFRDGLFDVVISSFGWEYVPDLAACLRGCHRVLKASGAVVVCTVHPLAAFEWDEGNKGLLVTNYFNLPLEIWEEPMGPGRQRGVTFFHTVQEMFELLTSTGFRVERILEPHPYRLYSMTEDEKRAIPYSGPDWEKRYERLSRVPFAIVYKALKL